MQHTLQPLLRLAAAFALGLLALAAQAGSSSVSSTASDSVGSSSTSIQKSSTSSSTRDRVAQGQYRIIDVVEVVQQPEMVRLQLQAVAAQDEQFFLTLPRQTAERARLSAGQLIEALDRPFGLAFAALDSDGAATPFFLVLDDPWLRELQSRPLAL